MLTTMLSSCFGGSSLAMRNGGEVTGSRSSIPLEPTPYGMVEVKRGYLKVGLTENDSLWDCPQHRKTSLWTVFGWIRRK